MEDENDPASSSSNPPAPLCRPATLNILLDNTLKSPVLPSLRTPSLEELQPLLRSEVEKFLQQLKASPQTPGSFLNPRHISDEQEHFAKLVVSDLLLI